jgi:hypothetical protein
MSVRVVISAQQAKASSSMYSGTRDIVTAAAIAGLTFLPHFVRGGRTEEKPRAIDRHEAHADNPTAKSAATFRGAQGWLLLFFGLPPERDGGLGYMACTACV